MSIIKLAAGFFAASLFLIGCNRDQTQRTGTNELYPNDAAIAENEGDEYWAKDNLDLQRVGNLLERSESPEQFERYLNEPDGIDNLDLNGDGYADYISVQEYDDQRDPNSRGLSLFSRFGPNLIQEIATILLHRDEPRYPGARFLINGNEQLYGDNNYYETNWLDRSIPLVSTLFGNHDRYSSPYYYDNYPTWYTPYDIIETPVYRTRVEQLYPQPAFVYTTTVPVYFEKIKIKSPNNGLHLGQIYAKLVKPTKEQAEFLKSNPGRKIGKLDQRDDKPGRDNPPRSDRGDERGNPAKADRGAERGNPDKPEVGKPEHQNVKPAKADNPGKVQNQGGGNPNKGGGDGKGQGGGGGKGKKP